MLMAILRSCEESVTEAPAQCIDVCPPVPRAASRSPHGLQMKLPVEHCRNYRAVHCLSAPWSMSSFTISLWQLVAAVVSRYAFPDCADGWLHNNIQAAFPSRASSSCASFHLARHGKIRGLGTRDWHERLLLDMGCAIGSHAAALPVVRVHADKD